MNNYEKVIIGILENLLMPTGKININSSSELREDLGLDSMSSLIFLMKLEEEIPEFKIDPQSLMTEDLRTVASVSDYIHRAVNTSENEYNLPLELLDE